MIFAVIVVFSLTGKASVSFFTLKMRPSLLLETLRYPEISVRVTGSAMFFSFCGDVIDLTR